jgi:CDP-glucose 4,6-dehydratase
MTRPDLTFWRGRRVLVTGHTGFKGGWLVLLLSELGAKVSGFGMGPPSSPSLFDAADVGSRVESMEGDVRDLDGLRAAMKRSRPEVLFHLAAQAIVRRSYEDPVGTYTTNVIGTANVLEATREADDLRVAVVATSDKCYRLPEDGRPCSEDDPLGGDDPYSSSKACAELVTAAYRDSFAGNGPAIASVRAGNVIGGGDWAADRLVPDAMRAATGGGGAFVVRSPDAVRPWQHVLCPLAGYVTLAERMWDDRGAAGAWNFGPDPGDDGPVREVADRVCRLWGDGLAWRTGGSDGHRLEAPVLRVDSGKARERLGWAPRWGLDEALAATVDWFRAYRDGADLPAVTLAQVREYLA